MPWDLSFPVDTLDARVEYRGILARLREHPEVAEISVYQHVQGPRPLTEVVRVFFRDESEQARDAWLRTLGELHRQDDPPPSEPGRTGLTVPTRELFNEEREEIIRQAMSYPQGRSRLLQSMIAPIRTRMDYQSIGRRTFLVEELPQGALPVYDRDPEVTRTMGWDGNGTPTASHPTPPLWAQPGQWAYNKRLDQYVLILERSPKSPMLNGVKAEVWRSAEGPRWFDVDYFYENWAPCEQPSDPKPLWDRLLGDDPL